DPYQVEALEAPGDEDRERFGDEPAPPIGLSQPVADLPVPARDVVEERDADAAGELVVDSENEVRLGLLDGGDGEPRLTRLGRVGVRKAIAEVPPDGAVVGEPNEAVDIARTPAAHGTVFGDQEHVAGRRGGSGTGGVAESRGATTHGEMVRCASK